jgi:hypothetical protein
LCNPIEKFLFFLLADTGKVDPSLAERQRMLKRARLADSLNDQLSHRPGPLELIQKNILHTDENVERAVKGIQTWNVGRSIPNYYIGSDSDAFLSFDLVIQQKARFLFERLVKDLLSDRRIPSATSHPKGTIAVRKVKSEQCPPPPSFDTRTLYLTNSSLF